MKRSWANWQNPFSGGEPAGSKAKREPARAGPFEEQRLKDERRLSRAVHKAFTRIEANYLKALRKERRATKELTDVPASFDLAEANREIFFEEIGTLPEQLMLEGGLQAQSLGLAVDFDLVNTRVLDSVATYKNTWWNELNFKTQENLRSAIATNISTGAPHRDLVKALEPTFGKVRADMIASTETTRLYAEGNRQGYASAGIGEVEFQTVRDSAVDPKCDALDGKVWSLNAEEAIPPIHVRCRCWLAPVAEINDAKGPLTTDDANWPDNWKEGLGEFESERELLAAIKAAPESVLDTAISSYVGGGPMSAGISESAAYDVARRHMRRVWKQVPDWVRNSKRLDALEVLGEPEGVIRLFHVSSNPNLQQWDDFYSFTSSRSSANKIKRELAERGAKPTIYEVEVSVNDIALTPNYGDVNIADLAWQEEVLLDVPVKNIVGTFT